MCRFKTPLCVHSKRPRVCWHHVLMFEHFWTWYTQRRFESTHGGFSACHTTHATTTTTHTTTHNHRHSHSQQHNATTHNTHNSEKNLEGRKALWAPAKLSQPENVPVADGSAFITSWSMRVPERLTLRQRQGPQSPVVTRNIKPTQPGIGNDRQRCVYCQKALHQLNWDNTGNGFSKS